MDWKNKRRSTNVEDRRGRPGVRRSPAKLGGGMVIIVVLGALLFGVDPGQILGLLAGGQAALPGGAPTQQAPATAPQDDAGEFAAVVLASTEDAWGRLFAQAGGTYQAPRLVLFTDGVQSACGMNSSATGPFYCPGDSQLYLDLGFMRELERLGASGDFAMAYVIGHEVGHHIQNLLGTEGRVRTAQRGISRGDANALSVRMELQADCYAGIWANYAAQDGDFLDSGDVQEGLRAAAAIGDDRLQRMSGRSVQPESFTHGSSEQRVEWFSRGYRSGSVDQCDSFAGTGIR